MTTTSVRSSVQTQVTASDGAAAGGHPIAARVAAEVLEDGGNAFDALVAGAFVSFVLEPAMCRVGGSGHFAGYLAEEERFVSVDHNIRAPRAAHSRMFEIDLDAPWHVYCHPATVGRRDERGYLASGVPGALAGLAAISDAWGTRPLRALLEPAISIAAEGIPIDWITIGSIINQQPHLPEFPAAARLLMPDGSPVGTIRGTTIIDASRLVDTLRLIASDGPRAFYDGDIATIIHDEYASHGGLLSRSDLADYRPRITVEAPASYRSMRYATGEDLVSLEALNILDGFSIPKLSPDEAAYRHIMAEALGLAFADNLQYVGDPEFVRIPIDGLRDSAYAAATRQRIADDKAVNRPIEFGDPWAFQREDGGNHHEVSSTGGVRGTSFLVTADGAGNLGALCTTVDSEFGSLVYLPEVGIFMNNSMQDFDPRPDRANSIEAGKRPLFGAPVLVAAGEDGALFASAGSGGYRIASGVVHALTNVMDHDMSAANAVDHPRVDCNGNHTFVDSRVSTRVCDELRARGHEVIVEQTTPWGHGFGRVGVVMRRRGTAEFIAASSPAWNSGSSAPT
jgi:gamma-glutamyltranspeptidase/glutathione hydrolase